MSTYIFSAQLKDPMKIKRLESSAILPTRNHETDAGIDFYSAGSYLIPPHEFRIIHTGIAIEIPKGYFALLKPKSRNDYMIGAGIIDEGYRGEILFKVLNPTDIVLPISRGQAVGQLVLIPTIYLELEEVNEFDDETERGSTGGIVSQSDSTSNAIFEPRPNISNS